jgi:integrase
MARKVRDSSLDTRAARARLRPRGKPYYRLIAPGLHIGYRKPRSGDGRWVARYYCGDGRYEVRTLGSVADDHSEANGGSILNFAQAQERVRQQVAARVHAGEGITAAPVYVSEAVENYIAERDNRDSKRRGREVKSDAGQRLRRYVLGQESRGKQSAIPAARLAKVELHALEDGDLRRWRAKLPDGLKAATKQRLINDLKAALNAAYSAHRKQLPPSFPETVKFGLKAQEIEEDDAPVPDSQVLPDSQITNILRVTREVDAEQGWEGDLYRLVVVLAATGARFSQAARLRVRDCQVRERRLLMPDSRKGRKKKIDSKTIPLDPNVAGELAPAVEGRGKNDWLLERWRHVQQLGGKWEKAERGQWKTSEITRPWQAIREKAKLPEVTPYCLRHSSIVRDIKANLPTRLVAAKHDTSEAIIRRHYARWITSDLEALVRDRLVPLLPDDSAGGKVLPLRGAR